MSQLLASNVSVVGATLPSVVSSLLTPICTVAAAEGCMASRTVNAAVVLPSSLTRSVVVCAPPVVGSVSTHTPALSSSIVVTSTITESRPSYPLSPVGPGDDGSRMTL